MRLERARKHSERFGRWSPGMGRRLQRLHAAGPSPSMTGSLQSPRRAHQGPAPPHPDPGGATAAALLPRAPSPPRVHRAAAGPLLHPGAPAPVGRPSSSDCQGHPSPPPNSCIINDSLLQTPDALIGPFCALSPFVLLSHL